MTVLFVLSLALALGLSLWLAAWRTIALWEQRDRAAEE